MWTALGVDLKCSIEQNNRMSAVTAKQNKRTKLEEYASDLSRYIKLDAKHCGMNDNGCLSPNGRFTVYRISEDFF